MGKGKGTEFSQDKGKGIRYTVRVRVKALRYGPYGKGKGKGKGKDKSLEQGGRSKEHGAGSIEQEASSRGGGAWGRRLMRFSEVDVEAD